MLATRLDDLPTGPRALHVSVRWRDTVLDAAHVTRLGPVTLDAGDGAPVHVATLSADGAAVHREGGDVRVAPGERVTFVRGALTYVAEWVDASAALGRGGVFDWTLPWMFSVSGLVHASIIGAAWVTPPRDPLEDALQRARIGKVTPSIFVPEVPQKPKKVELASARAGAKAKGAEGTAGRKDKPPREAARSRTGAPIVDAAKRKHDRDLVAHTGLLAMIHGTGRDSAVSSVLGAGGIGGGINEALDGIRGARLGDAGGAGGLGVRGSGSGGGGDALDIGGLATRGRGPGAGGYGDVQLDRGKGCRGCGEVRTGGRSILVGGLAQDEIARVIRRHLPRFKFCYERQLATFPDLGGKVAVSFTIDPVGRVAEAAIKESTLQNGEVERCVLEVTRSLEFPHPKGGGVVMVTYPFLFAST